MNCIHRETWKMEKNSVPFVYFRIWFAEHKMKLDHSFFFFISHVFDLIFLNVCILHADNSYL